MLCPVIFISVMCLLFNFPVYKTRWFAAILHMLKWFAGHQIRNVGVSWPYIKWLRSLSNNDNDNYFLSSEYFGRMLASAFLSWKIGQNILLLRGQLVVHAGLSRVAELYRGNRFHQGILSTVVYYIDLARAKSEASVSILMIKAIKFKSNNMNS